MLKPAVDLTVFADDKERQVAMDFLADAYATNAIDKPELERREDIVLAPVVRRKQLVEAVDGLGVDLFPKPEEPFDFGPLLCVGGGIVLLVALLVLVIVVF
jgi:hypothetical protein